MSEEPQDLYANAVNVTSSIYDVTLNFRTQSPVMMGQGKQPMFEASAVFNVRMSPQHAKALTALLVKHIQEYESKYQTQLPLPPELQQLWTQVMSGG